MAYSAGVAYLQVVPSFKNIQAEMEREVRKMAAAFEKAMSEAMPEGMREGMRNARDQVDRDAEAMGETVAEEVAEGVEGGVRQGARNSRRQAQTGGRDTGRVFGNAFERAATARIGRALQALGSDIDLEQPHRDIDRMLNAIRETVREIGSTDFGPNFNEGEFRDVVDFMRRELARIEQTTEGLTDSDFTGLRSARREFDVLHELVREAQRRGREAGGQFAGAFGQAASRRITQTLSNLPEIPLDVDPTPAQDDVLRIRKMLEDLRDVRIGVDMDTRTFTRRMQRIREEIHDLRNDPAAVELEMDLDNARESIDQFFERDLPQRAERSARAVGGVFDRQVRQGLGSALQSLPEVEIQANSTNAQRQLAELRARLLAFRDVHIDLDLDAGESLAQIRVLHAQLATLALTSPDVQVRVDAAAAAAQLLGILQLAHRIDGQDLRVRVDTDSAAAGLRRLATSIDVPVHRLGVLVSLGLTLGTTLVPAAAGLAPVLAAAAVAAAGAAAGVGVLALALSGVFGAVKALHKYQDDAAKSAKSLSGAQNQVANAAAGVRNAERGLASARSAAAESNRTAARQVVAAERSVIDSVRDRQRAERDLVEAIKEATRADEDRRLSIRGNALAQRQANLDIAEAKKELDKVLSNPKASEAEREQARLTYEQRVLQLDELKVSGSRLAEEQAKWNKEGAAGTDGVKAAQERLREATVKVADSQDRLAEAIHDQQRAQVQGAEQVASATEALAQAQRSMGQATVAAGVAGGESLDKLRDSMAALSPAGRRFAEFIFGLKDEFLSLRQAAERGVLPGLQLAMEELLRYLPGVTNFVEKLGTGIGNLFFEVVKGFQHREWQIFFDLIRDQSFGAIKGLVSFTTTFSRGMASLITSLSIFNQGIGNGLLEFASDFAEWAERLRHSNGFQEFVQYVSTQGPAVLDLIGEMAIFIKNFVIAAAPIGKFVVSVFTALFKVLNAIPLPALSILVGLMAIFSTRVLLLKAAAVGINVVLIPLVNGFLGLASAMRGVSTAATTAASSIALVGGAMTTTMGRTVLATGAVHSMSTAWGGVRTATGGAMTGLGKALNFLGGPWMIGLTIAAGALLYFSQQEDAVKKRAEEIQPGLRNLAEAMKQTGDAASETVKSIIASDKALQALILRAKSYGLEVDDVVKATEGDVAARRELLDAYDAEEARLKNLAREYNTAYTLKKSQAELDAILAQAGVRSRSELDKLIETQSAEGDALRKIMDEQKRQTEAQDLAAAATERLKLKQQELNAQTVPLTKAQQELREAVFRAGERARVLSDLIKVLGDTSATAEQRASALTAAIDAFTKTQISAIEAEERRIASEIELDKVLKENGTNFVVNTAKGNEYNESVLRSRDALQAALEASKAKMLADIEAGVPMEEAIRLNEERINKLLGEIKVTGENAAEVQNLANIYGRIPKEVQTAMSVKGAQQVLDQLKELKVAQTALDLNISVQDARAKVESQNQWRIRAATGGYIWGPGTETSDSIPAMLSRGEYVTRAKAVRYYGADFLRAVNDMSFPREHLAHYAMGGGPVEVKARFADGGPVLWPYPVDAYGTHVPTLAEVQSKVAVDPGTWPSSPAAQRGDSGVWRKIVQLIQSTGPLSGSFGNAYRPGDPLWHGSGRAVDWMGYNQDALAGILAAKRPLELIHRTNSKDYAYTRGRDRGSFSRQLMEEHRNHIHVAFDDGGWLQPGMSSVYNGLGKPEAVLTPMQSQALVALARQADSGNLGPRVVNNFEFANTRLDASRLQAMNDREAAYARVGRAR